MPRNWPDLSTFPRRRCVRTSSGRRSARPRLSQARGAALRVWFSVGISIRGRNSPSPSRMTSGCGTSTSSGRAERGKARFYSTSLGRTWRTERGFPSSSPTVTLLTGCSRPSPSIGSRMSCSSTRLTRGIRSASISCRHTRIGRRTCSPRIWLRSSGATRPRGATS